jgi:hypothetical protein
MRSSRTRDGTSKSQKPHGKVENPEDPLESLSEPKTEID